MSAVPKATELPIDWDRWVVVGHLAGQHGFPKQGVWTFRVKMLQVGSEALRSPSALKIFPPTVSTLEPVECAPVEDSSPLGAKWGQNSETLLRLSVDLSAYLKSQVAVPRKFVADSEDLLLDDLLGFEVWETLDSESRLGPIVGAGWTHAKTSPYLMIQGPEGVIELPLDWVSWEASRTVWEQGKRVLCVPEATQWKL